MAYRLEELGIANERTGLCPPGQAATEAPYGRRMVRAAGWLRSLARLAARQHPPPRVRLRGPTVSLAACIAPLESVTMMKTRRDETRASSRYRLPA